MNETNVSLKVALCLFFAIPSWCWDMRGTGESRDMLPIETSSCQLCSVGKLKPALYPKETSYCLFSSDGIAQLSRECAASRTREYAMVL